MSVSRPSRSLSFSLSRLSQENVVHALRAIIIRANGAMEGFSGAFVDMINGLAFVQPPPPPAPLPEPLAEPLDEPPIDPLGGILPIGHLPPANEQPSDSDSDVPASPPPPSDDQSEAESEHAAPEPPAAARPAKRQKRGEPSVRLTRATAKRVLRKRS